MHPPTVPRFSDRLATAIDRVGSPTCIGLDPVYEKLPDQVRACHHEPVRAIEEFCRAVLDAVAPFAAAIKPQSACFERYRGAGTDLLDSLIGQARDRGVMVILDAKRGDIGPTAEHYAHAAFHAGADAVTVNASMGFDTLEPFLNRVREHNKGLFVLVRTSNPGSDELQSARLADGRTVAELAADHVRAAGRGCIGARGLSDLGAVVGATKLDGASLRDRMPEQVFLMPGYGAQGGSRSDIRPMCRAGTSSATAAEWGVLVNASRSVLYPPIEGTNWKMSVCNAAERFADELRSLKD
ncbi:MAG: orotidine-5'-phosphate decarboxylase [Phycisphaerae bacterium]|nr:orotidine-5'-phosphate decarboxylase [Phycisphaerae bacterium]